MTNKKKRINTTLRTAIYTLAILLFIGAGQQTYAATYTVNGLGDAGDGTCDATCTLRDAILEANATADDDVIEFSVTGTITLSGTELTIANNGSLTINGPGASQLTVSANNASRVFFINNATVAIDGLTISDGMIMGATIFTGLGGGIFTGGSLTLTNSIVSNNSASDGGGIFSSGTLNVTNSTIDNNDAIGNGDAGDGGGISVQFGQLTITNSTISNNSATTNGGGGGIFVVQSSGTIINSTISTNSAVGGGGIATLGSSPGDVLTITNSTISNNSASTNGGGIASFSGSGNELNLVNSIVANSTNGGDCANVGSGTINASHSLIEDGLGCLNGTDTNNLTVDPALGPLQDNGGPTLTHALSAGSQAINAGDNAQAVDENSVLLTTDQRGASRFIYGTVDMGAVEALHVNSTNDPGVGICDLTECTLREAITLANGTSFNEVIEFARPPFDTSQTITLTMGELVIANNGTLTINGPGANLLTVSGNNASRVFSISNSATAAIDGLTISNGNGVGVALSGQGGGILVDNPSTLTLTNSTVSNNSGTFGGGISSIGTLTVNKSTIDNNNATNGGGIRVLRSGTITNSTISNNSADLGGGIFNDGLSGNALTITNSTISNNSASNRAGGIDNAGITGGGVTNLINSIIANSTGGDCLNELGGTLNASYSLVEDGSCGVTDGVNNNKTGDPLLAPLGNYGGPTQTHALLPGSPAIDAADPNNFPQFDQRGNVRPADGNPTPLRGKKTSDLAPTGLLPDMGAFEFLAPTAAGAAISGKVTLPNGRAIPRAVVHITDQNGNIRTARTNMFGYYKFINIEVGQTLVANVYSKGHQFETQVISFNDSITGLNFIAQGGSKGNKSYKKRE